MPLQKRRDQFEKIDSIKCFIFDEVGVLLCDKGRCALGSSFKLKIQSV